MNYIDKIDSLMATIQQQKETELNVLNAILEVLKSPNVTNDYKVAALTDYVSKIIKVTK
jgi:hypothetical protein